MESDFFFQIWQSAIKADTLDFLISVGLRLLVFGTFSRVYGLIREPMLIEFNQFFFAEIFKIMKTEKL